MSIAPGGFYSEERWENWLDRVREADLDLEEEESARLLLNMQSDVAIAVAKIIRAVEEGIEDEDGEVQSIDAENAFERLTDIEEIVLTDPKLGDDEKSMFVNGVQTRLEVVLYAAEEYLAEGPAEEAGVEDYLRAARDAEAEDDFQRAIGLAVFAGTRVIAGDEFDEDLAHTIEDGVTTEWIYGLDSLQDALGAPEVVEEE